MPDATADPLSGDAKRWLTREEFVRRVLGHQADSELAKELDEFVPDTTGDLPPW